VRFNFRIKKKIGNREFTVFIMVSETQTLEGITSLLPNGLHYPLFDIEKCTLEEAENGLMKVQISYGLSDIFITSDIERSYRAFCYTQVKFTDYLRMQLDLLDYGLLDYNFFWWTVNKSKATLRVSNKKNRSKQKPVSVLESFYVPVQNLREKVIYDTGIEKRGLTVFLGEKGRVIHG